MTHLPRASMIFAPCVSSSVMPVPTIWNRSPEITIVVSRSTAAAPVREGWMMVAPLMTVTGGGSAVAESPGRASAAASKSLGNGM